MEYLKVKNKIVQNQLKKVEQAKEIQMNQQEQLKKEKENLEKKV